MGSREDSLGLPGQPSRGGANTQGAASWVFILGMKLLTGIISLDLRFPGNVTLSVCLSIYQPCIYFTDEIEHFAWILLFNAHNSSKKQIFWLASFCI